MRAKRRKIGICGGRIFEMNTTKFINEITRVGKKYNYFSVVFAADYISRSDTDEIIGEKQLFELAKFADVDALVVLEESIKNPTLVHYIIEVANELGIPCFVSDHEFENCYYLAMDYSAGFEEVVRHVVVDHGCKKVNMIGGMKDNEFSDARINMYKKVLAENGIEFEEERLGYGDFWERPTKAVMRKFLKSELPFPDAIICANDSMAMVACEMLRENGYKVPEDVIVTGFDGTQTAKFHYPTITTAEPDYEGVATYIFDEIDRIRDGGKIEHKKYMTNVHICKEQSCGCCDAGDFVRNSIITNLWDDLGDCAWHTVAMNQLVTSVASERDMDVMIKNLPNSEEMWSENFRFSAIKKEIMTGTSAPDGYAEMQTILSCDNGVFELDLAEYPIDQFILGLDSILWNDSGYDVVVIHLLYRGRQVFGFAADGFEKLDTRDVQRSNEYSLFVSHSINTVLQNRCFYDINENLSQAYSEIAALSIMDPMTNIYNRRGFYHRFPEIMVVNANKFLTIMSIDMNKLKYVNDTFGHAEGDFAIKTLANAIVKVCGEEAVCARFGGDEFTVAMFSDFETEIKPEEFTKYLQETIDNTAGVKDKPYPITASVGIYGEWISAELDLEKMINEADRRMYTIKKSDR